MKASLSGPVNLTGKVAIVTGAGRGIGQAICKALAREGAKIAACDLISLDETIQQTKDLYKDSTIIGVNCDISIEKEVTQATKKVKDSFGRIDILVGNAAIAGSVTPDDKDFLDVPIEEWDILQKVNVRGTALCCRAVWPIMSAQQNGKIVLIGSLAAKVGGVLYGPYYAATKGAIHTFVKWIAKRGLRHGIYVNAISPGPIVTPMGSQAPFTNDMVPVGRLGQPEDIAEAVIFLVSDASNFITGTVLDVNGGMLMD